MTPFFFGATGRRLFGVYDAPRGPSVRRGVVICYPIGPEYYCAHRASSALARHLAEGGMEVLRFDYAGTGDSEGEVCDFVSEDWTADIGLAVEELKDMTGLTKVSLVGLRFGAALALAAAKPRRDLDRIVLWDPTLDPDECLGGRDRDRHSDALIAGLRELGAGDLGEPTRPTLKVVTDPEAGVGGDIPADAPDDPPAATESRRCPGLPVWEEGDDFGTAELPVHIMRTISEWLKQTG